MAKKSTVKIAIFVIILFAAFLPPLLKYQQVRSRSKNLDHQIESLKKENNRLEEERRRLQTDIIYVEKRARDKTGVARKGEIILKSSRPKR
jgi:cell division protein FtsB